jgi:hypothetical protein
LDMSGGKPVSARLQRVVLGGNTDVHGEIGWPARAGAPWTVTASGRSLDASGMLTQTAAALPNPTDDNRALHDSGQIEGSAHKGFGISIETAQGRRRPVAYCPSCFRRRSRSKK